VDCSPSNRASGLSHAVTSGSEKSRYRTGTRLVHRCLFAELFLSATFNSSPLALRVHIERAAGRPDEAALPGQAIHQYFKARAAGSRRTLRALFRRGRISLSI
jgi:hypothetical protein